MHEVRFHDMKRLVFFCILTALFLLSDETVAQRNRHYDDSLAGSLVGRVPRSIVIKTNILPVVVSQIPLAGEYRLMAEFVTGRRQSVFAGASWMGKSLFATMSEKANNQDPTRIRGYRIQGGYKIYLTPWHFRPAGFYIGPHASWARARMDYPSNPDNYIEMTHFNMNLLAGLQFIVNNRLSADFFIGHGYKNNHWREYDLKSLSKQVEDIDMGVITNIHYKFSFGCNIGIAL